VSGQHSFTKLSDGVLVPCDTAKPDGVIIGAQCNNMEKNKVEKYFHM
jgi:hypothetical protein